jgi:hypothetical protein
MIGDPVICGNIDHPNQVHDETAECKKPEKVVETNVIRGSIGSGWDWPWT